MDHILKPGQVVKVGGGTDCRVEKFLGSGGQGEVYRATLLNQPVALKWYYPGSATPEQREMLKKLVDRKAPTDQFLWPLDLATSKSLPHFGYVMLLRPERFKGIVDLMKGRVKPSFRSLTKLGYDLSHSFLRLHSAGLCYSDISFGNVFFDPETGEGLICDNDNVAVDGEGVASVLGTPRFMAPEIVRGEAKPSAHTDLFSLAVLLFYIFHVGHPLEGKKEASIRCFDKPAMDKLYGTEPLFIFDPNDTSNSPEPGYNDNPVHYWKMYPEFLRNLFLQSFTDGLRDVTHGRVKDSQWRSAMIRLRNSIFYCASCTAENFYDGGPRFCWNCKKPLVLPMHLRIGRNTIIMLNADTELYPFSLDPMKEWGKDAPVAKLVQHPTTPGLWGLENLSSVTWTYISLDGRIIDVEPGKRAPLVVGAKINFGTLSAEAEISI